MRDCLMDHHMSMLDNTFRKSMREAIMNAKAGSISDSYKITLIPLDILSKSSDRRIPMLS